MILIADSGSTKTDWRALSADGETGQFRTVGFNPYYQDTDNIYKELHDNLLPQLQGEKPVQIYFYGAGCSSPEKVKIVADAIEKLFPQTEVHVEHDLLAAARGLCGHEPGLPCILGTGCNSCVYDGKNITANVPSLGFMLGDEGSGGYIGRHLVQLYLNNELPQDLYQRFGEQFNHVTREEILENVYHKPFPNRYLASFATFLKPNNTHPFIQDLMREDFQQFFNRQLCKYPEHTSLPAHFVGSIAYYNQDILREVAAKNSVTIDRILRSPMDGLMQYHLELLKK